MHNSNVCCDFKDSPLKLGWSSLLALQPFPSAFLFPHDSHGLFLVFEIVSPIFVLLAVKSWADSVHVFHHGSLSYHC